MDVARVLMRLISFNSAVVRGTTSEKWIGREREAVSRVKVLSVKFEAFCRTNLVLSSSLPRTVSEKFKNRRPSLRSRAKESKVGGV